MLSTRTEELFHSLLDGEASSDDIQELQELIGSDDHVAAHLADLITEHRLLGLIHRPFDAKQCNDSVMNALRDDQRQSAIQIAAAACGTTSNVKAEPIASGQTRRLSLLASVAFCVAACVMPLVAWNYWVPEFGDRTGAEINRAEIPVFNKPQVWVATLLLEDDCVWTSDSEVAEGQRLPAQALKLESGFAIIRFDGGAELVLKGRTSLVLKTAGSAELKYGDVVIRAEGEADGFELATPMSPLIDLGTEFAVRVDESGATEVHVLEGEVEYRKGSAPDVLKAGRAIRFDGSNATPSDVELDSTGFDEVVRQVAPKPQPHRMFAYDGFFYETGELSLAWTSKGKGWAGPWRLRLPEERRMPEEETSPDHFEIVRGQLNVTWPVLGGRARMLKLPEGNSFYVRPLKQSIDLDRNTVTYFSLMVGETERRTERKPPREGLRLTFRSSRDYFGEAISFGHGSGFRPHIQTDGGIGHVSPLVLPPEQTTLWVGKIVARTDGEDEIYFRVYGEQDELGYAEPATWHVITRGVNLDARLDRVVLTSVGKTSRIIDELRIGPTWRSVAPMREE